MASINSEVAASNRRDRFASYFGGRDRALLTVIHVRDEEQALRSVGVAQGGGADGVFLASHGIGYQKLLRIARAVVDRHHGLFVGVRCLDLRPQDVFCRLPQGVSGVWADETGVDQSVSAAVHAARREAGWNGLYFGSIAPEDGLGHVETRVAALEHIDVLAVRSQASHEPPAVDMLRMPHEARGRPPLAVVFDTAPESIAAYLPYVDCVLMTPASDDGSCELDPARVRELGRTIRAYSKRST